MKNIVPYYILSDSIHIEQSPIGYRLAPTHRGVELVSTVMAADTPPLKDSAHAYRSPLNRTTTHEFRPVIVRVLSRYDENSFRYRGSAFERVVGARRILQNAGAPKILYLLGKDEQIWASVEEYVFGARLRAILNEHQKRGQQLPEALALAVGASLLSLWFLAIKENISIRIELDDVLIDEVGRIRILPEYHEEESEQQVGAALLVLNRHAASVSPEEIRGDLGDERSFMFSFGLLLYELLTGSNPHKRDHGTLFGTLSSIVRNDTPFLRTHRPDVHPVVASFVHRCLDREPKNRFSNWNEFNAAYVGMQSLFAPLSSRDLADFALRFVPDPEERACPQVVVTDRLEEFCLVRLKALDLPDISPNTFVRRAPMTAMRPAVDPEAEFAGTDGRPMLRVSNSLLIDARPVTKAEVERYFFATRQAFPPLLQAKNAPDEDTACVVITAEIAEAYASWAGKRLPTEAEWELAVKTLGPERLDMGEMWEWTMTRHEHEGRVVRGGRWRDQADLQARPENRSYATNAARDIGFRCVATPNDASRSNSQ